MDADGPLTRRRGGRQAFASLYGRGLQLATGSAAAQLASFLAVPLLARVYNPEAFGAFAIFFLGAQTLGTSLAARYEQAIVLADDGREAGGLLQLSLVIAAAATLVFVVALAFAGPALDALTGVALGWWWPLVAICGLLVSVQTSLSMLAIREQRFRAVSAARFAKAAAALGLQLGIGLWAFGGVAGLAAGETLGVLAAALILGWTLRRRPGFPTATGRSGWTDLRPLVRRHATFPLVNLPHNLINSLVPWFSVLLITGAFSAAEAGQYFLMQRLAMLPAGLIGLAMSQVYYAAAADDVRKTGSFGATFRQVAIGQAAMGLVLALVLALWAPPLFGLVLGPGWGLTGELAVAFAPFVGMHLVLSTLGPTGILARRQGAALLAGVLQHALFAGSLTVGVLLHDSLVEVVRLAAWVTVPFMAGVLFWYWTLARVPVR